MKAIQNGIIDPDITLDDVDIWNLSEIDKGQAAIKYVQDYCEKYRLNFKWEI